MGNKHHSVKRLVSTMAAQSTVNTMYLVVNYFTNEGTIETHLC